MGLNQHRNKQEHLQQVKLGSKHEFSVLFSVCDEIRAIGTNFTEMWYIACLPYYDAQSFLFLPETVIIFACICFLFRILL
jgi:hypothetical protein